MFIYVSELGVAEKSVPQYVAFFELQQRILEDNSRDPSKIEIRNCLQRVSTLSNMYGGSLLW